MLIARFDIQVVPPSKKNSERIVMIGRRPSLRASAQYELATAAAVPQLVEQWQAMPHACPYQIIGRRNGPPMDGAPLPMNSPLHMKCTFHVLCRSDSKNAPDLMNLLHAPADWLEPPKWNKAETAITTPGAGVIANDRLIRSVDGSRIVFECDGCPDRRSGCNYRFETRLKTDGSPWMRKGKAVRDKYQVCERGRIEIVLREWEAD